jgi:hypothetical protein
MVYLLNLRSPAGPLLVVSLEFEMTGRIFVNGISFKFKMPGRTFVSGISFKFQMTGRTFVNGI